MYVYNVYHIHCRHTCNMCVCVHLLVCKHCMINVRTDVHRCDGKKCNPLHEIPYIGCTSARFVDDPIVSFGFSAPRNFNTFVLQFSGTSRDIVASLRLCACVSLMYIYIYTHGLGATAAGMRTAQACFGTISGDKGSGFQHIYHSTPQRRA